VFARERAPSPQFAKIVASTIADRVVNLSTLTALAVLIAGALGAASAISQHPG